MASRGTIPKCSLEGVYTSRRAARRRAAFVALEMEGRKRTDADEALMEEAVAEGEASGSAVMVSWEREREVESLWSSAR